MALWRIRATVDDRPGYLSVLTASLALRSINILSVQAQASEGGAVDDFLVDAPDTLTDADLRAAVVKGRGRDPWIQRTDAYDLVDPQTHLLGLAGRLVREPHELDSVLGSLLGCAVRWRPDEGPTWQGFTDSAMALPDPAGGTIYLDRDAPPFTPAEYARANALVELAAAATAKLDAGWRLLLAGGAELEVRPAGPEDLDAVVALHERCGRDSRYRRYLSGSAVPRRAQLSRLIGSGYALAAHLEDGRPGPAGGVGGAGTRVVALLNAVREGTEAEIGLLVEDAWQRRGLGTALLRRAVRQLAAGGIEAVHAHLHADNHAMIRTLRRLGLPLRHETDGPLTTVMLDLRLATVDPGGGPAPAPEAITGRL
ncbi:MAG: GNAT family N-acetyltransferase [Micromonosporaceae bacterium]|nr:GNAT family N-acetyltransferase [Micromonosporaceae bacterium]